MFHETSRPSRKVSKGLRATGPSPRDVLLGHLTKRGWKARDLADRLSSSGDDPNAQLRTRALIGFYLSHPTGEIELGSILAAQLDEAFGLPRDSFRRLDRAWVDAHRMERAQP